MDDEEIKRQGMQSMQVHWSRLTSYAV